MRSHLMNDCLNVLQICSVCEGKEVTSKIGDHNCIYILKAKLRQKEEELAKKDAENEALTKQMIELKLQVANQQSMPKHIDAGSQAVPRCLKGHVMRLTNKPIQRIVAGHVFPGVNLRCNGCRQSFNMMQGYFHCGQSSCDYDFCRNCGL